MRKDMRIARFCRKSNLPVFKKNEDYGDGWTKKLDEAREQDAEDGENLIDPLDIAGYCGKEKNVKYWEEMGDSPAAKDFQKYIKQVKCSNE